MLKRSESAALSKAALQRVASGKAGVIPPNKKHTERLAKLKKDKIHMVAKKDCPHCHRRDSMKLVFVNPAHKEVKPLGATKSMWKCEHCSAMAPHK